MKALLIATWALRLTSITCLKASMSMYSTGPPWPMPALLTRPLSPLAPTLRWIWVLARAIEASFATSSVTGVRASDPSAFSESASFFLRTSGENLEARPVQLERSGAADPGGGPGD